MAKEELNSQVIIFNDHYCIMPTYFAVMTMPPTTTWQDILEESVKPILIAIPNKYLVDNNEETTIIDSDNSFSTILHFSDCRSGSSNLLREANTCCQKGHR